MKRQWMERKNEHWEKDMLLYIDEEVRFNGTRIPLPKQHYTMNKLSTMILKIDCKYTLQLIISLIGWCFV